MFSEPSAGATSMPTPGPIVLAAGIGIGLPAGVGAAGPDRAHDVAVKTATMVSRRARLLNEGFGDRPSGDCTERGGAVGSRRRNYGLRTGTAVATVRRLWNRFILRTIKDPVSTSQGWNGVSMLGATRRVHWQEISSLDPVPGVYSWYFTPDFTDFDLRQLEASIGGPQSAGLIESFIQQHLLRYVREDPYEVDIRGSLKAPYSGQLHHRQTVSPDLLARLASEAGRCREIGAVLSAIVPVFCAPLYIGMARNLRTRLSTHKRLIMSLNEGAPAPPVSNEEDASVRDHSFANSVFVRGIPVSQLCVYILPLENPGLAIDVENLLNRISYPVIGRN